GTTKCVSYAFSASVCAVCAFCVPSPICWANPLIIRSIDHDPQHVSFPLIIASFKTHSTKLLHVVSLVVRFINTVTYGSAEPHSPPRRGGVDAPPIRWREATESGADGVVRPARPGFRRTDHPGASRHPSSARRGIRQRNFQTQH